MMPLRQSAALVFVQGFTLGLFTCWGQGQSPASAAGKSQSVSAFANFEGKKVHYVDTGGTKPAVVLVHGWACDGTVWKAQLESLAPRLRVIAIDLPGHGQSQIPDGDFSMDLFAKATAAVMDHAGVERAVLVGHSNGTPVIRQFYRLFPRRTRALVVVDGALKQMLNSAILEQMKPRLSEANYRDTVSAMIDSMPGDGLDQGMRAQIKSIGRAQPQAAVLGGLLAAADPKVFDPDPIEAPLLLILAKQPSWNDEYLRFVNQLAPQAQIHILPGVSHFIMVERPSEFDALLLTFLDGHHLLQ